MEKKRDKNNKTIKEIISGKTKIIYCTSSKSKQEFVRYKNQYITKAEYKRIHNKSRSKKGRGGQPIPVEAKIALFNTLQSIYNSDMKSASYQRQQDEMEQMMQNFSLGPQTCVPTYATSMPAQKSRRPLSLQKGISMPAFTDAHIYRNNILTQVPGLNSQNEVINLLKYDENGDVMIRHFWNWIQSLPP
jgi:hypothetical protein